MIDYYFISFFAFTMSDHNPCTNLIAHFKTAQLNNVVNFHVDYYSQSKAIYNIDNKSYDCSNTDKVMSVLEGRNYKIVKTGVHVDAFTGMPVIGWQYSNIYTAVLQKAATQSQN